MTQRFDLYITTSLRPPIFFTLAPSYRLQNEQVGHLHELPGGLRVPNSDRWILPGAGAGAMDTWLSFFPPSLPLSQRPESAEFRSWAINSGSEILDWPHRLQ